MNGSGIQFILIHYLLLLLLSIVCYCCSNSVTNAQQKYNNAYSNHACIVGKLFTKLDKKLEAEKNLGKAIERGESSIWVLKETLRQADQEYQAMRDILQQAKQQRDLAKQEFDQAKQNQREKKDKKGVGRDQQLSQINTFRFTKWKK